MQGTSQNITWQNPATKGCSNTPFSLGSCKLSFNSREILLGFVYVFVSACSASVPLRRWLKSPKRSSKHRAQPSTKISCSWWFMVKWLQSSQSYSISLIPTSFSHLALCTSQKKLGEVKQLLSPILVAVSLTREKQSGGPCTLLCECNDHSVSSSTPISSYRLETHFWHWTW